VQNLNITSQQLSDINVANIKNTQNQKDGKPNNSRAYARQPIPVKVTYA
jgi:hypothetical protein